MPIMRAALQPEDRDFAAGGLSGNRFVFADPGASRSENRASPATGRIAPGASLTWSRSWRDRSWSGAASIGTADRRRFPLDRDRPTLRYHWTNDQRGRMSDQNDVTVFVRPDREVTVAPKVHPRRRVSPGPGRYVTIEFVPASIGPYLAADRFRRSSWIDRAARRFTACNAHSTRLCCARDVRARRPQGAAH